MTDPMTPEQQLSEAKAEIEKLRMFVSVFVQRGDLLTAQNLQITLERDRLREALELAKPYVEREYKVLASLIPQDHWHGPDSNCDGACADVIHTARKLDQIEQALSTPPQDNKDLR